jgi:hypothetical protein
MSDLRRRLLLTALFGVVGAVLGIGGAGHAYLRKWRRSVLWFLVSIGSFLALVSIYIPDLEAIDPYDVGAYPPEVITPLVVILGFSVVDALLVAFLDQREAELTPGIGTDVSDADEGVSCPHCGRSTDPELDFCTWCTESLQPPETPDNDDPN